MQSSSASPNPEQPTNPEECTGDAEVDAILAKADMKTVLQLTDESREASWDPAVYTWKGFCDAVRYMQGAGQPLYQGRADSSVRVAQVLSNIASLLAQCAWESGADVPFHACDENNYKGTVTAPCTQRDDGRLYSSLTSPPACYVDP